ncbi:hypothetical protein TNCV_1540971 [Trichonephila clavipes]|nr:hypothetical protein TNCV_1540971 [Trichonephila clavipes]
MIQSIYPLPFKQRPSNPPPPSPCNSKPSRKYLREKMSTCLPNHFPHGRALFSGLFRTSQMECNLGNVYSPPPVSDICDSPLIRSAPMLLM